MRYLEFFRLIILRRTLLFKRAKFNSSKIPTVTWVIFWNAYFWVFEQDFELLTLPFCLQNNIKNYRLFLVHFSLHRGRFLFRQLCCNCLTLWWHWIIIPPCLIQIFEFDFEQLQNSQEQTLAKWWNYIQTRVYIMVLVFFAKYQFFGIFFIFLSHFFVKERNRM